MYNQSATLTQIKPLAKFFIGRGEVKGFKFTQISKTDKVFLYEVSTGDLICYEVFKKRQNMRFGCVSYPTSKAFGIWAWTLMDFNDAIQKFDLLTYYD